MNEVFDELLANPALQTVGTAILFAVVALWLAAAWWAYQDASRRTESTTAGFVAAAWIIVSTPLMLPLSLAVYAMARPQSSASDSRTERLMARLNEIAADRPSCPGCAVTVDPDWLRCPYCATWFALECQACGEWSAAGLEVCPFCGTDREAVPAGWVPADPAAAAIAGDPGAGVPGSTRHAGRRLAGHGTAAAGKPAAAGGATMSPRASKPRLQRGRMASSLRPASYEASRASSSVSS